MQDTGDQSAGLDKLGGKENVTEVSLSCVRFAINSSFPIVSFGRPHKKTVSKGCRFVVAPVMFARVS